MAVVTEECLVGCIVVEVYFYFFVMWPNLLSVIAFCNE